MFKEWKEIECQLLDLQFRSLQTNMLDLKVLNADTLKIDGCEVKYSMISTPMPTSEMFPEVTTSAPSI